MKGSEELASIESGFVPNVGEWIWFDASVQNPIYYEVTGRVIDLDKRRNRLNVTLLVK